MHSFLVEDHIYSSHQKNGDVSVPFCPVQMEVKWPFHAQKNGNRTGQRLALGKRRKVQSTIPIIASTKKTLGESKKAKRSITLSKQSHLEADWHLKVDQLSIADFDPSQALIVELTRNRRVAVENCSRDLKRKDGSSIKLSILVGEWTSWLPFLHIIKLRPLLPIVRVCIWSGKGMASMNGAMPSGRGGMERKCHLFLAATVWSNQPCCATWSILSYGHHYQLRPLSY